MNGRLEKIEVGEREVLIFRLNRVTSELSVSYINEAKKQLRSVLPEGVHALMVGCDIDVFLVAGEAATSLKIKGIAK